MILLNITNKINLGSSEKLELITFMIPYTKFGNYP